MNDDWRVWRPAIWLVMLGVAVMLLFSPWYLGAVFFGAAIGSAIRIRQRRQRALAAAGKHQPQRRQRVVAAAAKRQPQRRKRSGRR